MRARRLVSSILSLLLVSFGSAAAQTGWVHLDTRMAADAPGSQDYGVMHAYQQGQNGLEEVFSFEFAPGNHSLTKVVSTYGACTAESGPVSFTITAGHWTEVDVVIHPTTCTFQAVPFSSYGGAGSERIDYEQVQNGFVTLVDCFVQFGASQHPSFPNFHACQGTAPYGATLRVVNLPAAGTNVGIVPDTGFFVLDTGYTSQFPGYAVLTQFFEGSLADDPVAEPADVSISRVDGTLGGMVWTGTFHVVNHGPGVARNVIVTMEGSPNEDIAGGTEAEMLTLSDGNCTRHCVIGQISPGDSVTVHARINSIPAAPGPGQFPTEAIYCSVVQVAAYFNGSVDPVATNDTTPCTIGSVPVTVTLGGQTPGDQTVGKGSTLVPMLEFNLDPATQQTVNSVTLQGTGSGNESLDVTAINLYLDHNGNGHVDPGDSVLATSTFAANNGTAMLTLNPGLSIASPTSLLVTYSFSLTVAQRLGGGLALAVLPLCFMPVVRRRRGIALAVATILVGFTASSCGSSGPTTPSGTTSTYQVKLTGINISGVDVPGVSINGSTVTIAK